VINFQAKAGNLAKIITLTLATVFVVEALVNELVMNQRISKSTAQIDVDRCKLVVRVNHSLEQVSGIVFGSNSSHELGAETKQLVRQGLAPLLASKSQTPQDPLVLAKALIISECLNESGDDYLLALESVGSQQATDLASILKTIYEPQETFKYELKSLRPKLEQAISSGWYQDQVLLRLYKKLKDESAYQKLKEKIEANSLALFARLAMLASVATLLLILGTAVLVVQIFLFRRPRNLPGLSYDSIAPYDYGWLNVYAVFLAWLSTQVAVGMIAKPILKSLTVGHFGIFGLASITALNYLIGNGPALLYVYLFVLMPHNLKFTEALKLNLRYGSSGPLSMIGLGLCTWLAAIPLMFLAYYLANKYLGSHGSSNPIIAIVTEAARSQNLKATLLFFLTLGVMAPICEEILFRGFLYPYLRRFWGVLPSLLVSAGLFSVIHLDPGGYLPLFCLGSVFALALERTKSVVPCIIAHGLWNSSTFALVLLLYSS